MISILYLKKGVFLQLDLAFRDDLKFSFNENHRPELKFPELIACILTIFVGYYSKVLLKIIVRGILSIALIRLIL